MPAGRKRCVGAKKFKPITLGPKFAVEGGLLNEPFCVTLEGPDKKYLEVKKKSPWLCMAAAGVTYSKSPLHRTKLLDMFNEVMNKGPDEFSLGKADMMTSLMTSMSGAKTSALAAASPSALAAASTSALAAASPLPVKGKKKNSKRASVEFSKVISFKKKWNGSAKHDWRLWRKKDVQDKVWLHIDDVPLAIQYLHDERLEYGVPADQEMEASDDDGDDDDDDGDEDNSHGDDDSGSSPCITFDRRDLSWQGKVRGKESGEVHRVTRCVPMKDDNKKTYTPEAFAARKAMIKLEVQKCLEQKRKR